jgi:hypothetical protein
MTPTGKQLTLDEAITLINSIHYDPHPAAKPKDCWNIYAFQEGSTLTLRVQTFSGWKTREGYSSTITGENTLLENEQLTYPKIMECVLRLILAVETANITNSLTVNGQKALSTSTNRSDAILLPHTSNLTR